MFHKKQRFTCVTVCVCVWGGYTHEDFLNLKRLDEDNPGGMLVFVSCCLFLVQLTS